MGESVPPEGADLPYPESVDRTWRGRERATACLVEWVRHAFMLLAKSTPPVWSWGWFKPPLDASAARAMRQVSEKTEEWRQLSADELLDCWIYVASHDERIAGVYGTSENLFDKPYIELQIEARQFLNDLLRRMDAFSEEEVHRQALEFWEDLASGTKTYEIGAIVWTLAIDADVDVIRVGPCMELHRVAGSWAAERFERAEELPPNRWAATVRVTRKREPLREWRDYTEEAREALINRALLALRLARPEAYLRGVPYRVCGKGDRNPPELAPWNPSWQYYEKRFPPMALSSVEVADLTELGAILQQVTRAPEVEIPAERESTDLLELASRTFTSAFERRTWQDKVVDLAEVLEALFARQTTEITYKAAMRAALFLGRDAESSARVFNTLKQFYSLRSGIVHAEPGQRSSSARKAVRLWGFGVSDKKTDAWHGSQAAKVGFGVAAAALRGFLYLRTRSDTDPFAKPFVEELDRLAFDAKRREELQATARVRL